MKHEELPGNRILDGAELVEFIERKGIDYIKGCPLLFVLEKDNHRGIYLVKNDEDVEKLYLRGFPSIRKYDEVVDILKQYETCSEEIKGELILGEIHLGDGFKLEVYRVVSSEPEEQ